MSSNVFSPQHRRGICQDQEFGGTVCLLTKLYIEQEDCLGTVKVMAVVKMAHNKERKLVNFDVRH